MQFALCSTKKRTMVRCIVIIQWTAVLEEVKQ